MVIESTDDDSEDIKVIEGQEVIGQDVKVIPGLSDEEQMCWQVGFL